MHWLPRAVRGCCCCGSLVSTIYHSSMKLLPDEVAQLDIRKMAGVSLCLECASPSTEQAFLMKVSDE